MKRPSEEHIVEQARKEQMKLVKQEVDKKLKVLTSYVEDEDACAVPGGKSVREMLVAAVPYALGLEGASDARAVYQTQVADMLKEVVTASDKKWSQAVAEATAGVEAAADAHNKAVFALTSAKEAVEAQKTDLASKENELSEAIKEDQEAAAALESANSEVAKFDEETDKVKADKDQCSEVLEKCWGPLKSGEWASKGDQSKFFNDTKKILKKIGNSFDESLLVAVTAAAGKKPADRGNFDMASVTNTDEQLAKYLKGLEERIGNAEHFKAEKVSKQAAAAATAESKKKKLEDARAAVKAAKEELGARNTAVKEANKDVGAKVVTMKEASSKLKQMNEDSSHAKDSLEACKYLYERPTVPVVLSASDVILKHLEVVDGLKAQAAIIDLCTKSAETSGSVQIDAAKKIFGEVVADGIISQEERWSLRFCLAKFNWADDAQTYIQQSLEPYHKQASEPSPKKRKTGKSYYEVVDGVKCDRSILNACREAVAGMGDGRVSLEDAKKVLAEAVDGGKITYYEHWSLCYCFTEFNWTKAAHDWIIEELKKF